jgi:hypothetical protein
MSERHFRERGWARIGTPAVLSVEGSDQIIPNFCNTQALLPYCRIEPNGAYTWTPQLWTKGLANYLPGLQQGPSLRL